MLQLERPLTVKYVERVLFDAVVDSGIQDESLESMTREQFLEEL